MTALIGGALLLAAPVSATVDGSIGVLSSPTVSEARAVTRVSTATLAVGVRDRDPRPRMTAVGGGRHWRIVAGGLRVTSLSGWRTDADFDAFARDRGGREAMPTLVRSAATGGWAGWRGRGVAAGVGSVSHAGRAHRLGRLAGSRGSWMAEWLGGGDEHVVAIRGGDHRRAITAGIRRFRRLSWRVVVRYRGQSEGVPFDVLATRTVVPSSARDGLFERGRGGSALRLRAGPVELRHAWVIGEFDTTRTSGVRVRGRGGAVRFEVRADRSLTTRGSLRVDATLDDGWQIGAAVRASRSGASTSFHPTLRVTRRGGGATRIVGSVHRAVGGGGWAAFGGGPRRVERAWLGDRATLITLRLARRRWELVGAERTGARREYWIGFRWKQ